MDESSEDFTVVFVLEVIDEEADVEEKIEESKPYGENVFYAGSRERNT